MKTNTNWKHLELQRGRDRKQNRQMHEMKEDSNFILYIQTEIERKNKTKNERDQCTGEQDDF